VKNDSFCAAIAFPRVMENLHSKAATSKKLARRSKIRQELSSSQTVANVSIKAKTGQNCHFPVTSWNYTVLSFVVFKAAL
jgi:hypothetical protein